MNNSREQILVEMIDSTNWEIVQGWTLSNARVTNGEFINSVGGPFRWIIFRLVHRSKFKLRHFALFCFSENTTGRVFATRQRRRRRFSRVRFWRFSFRHVPRASGANRLLMRINARTLFKYLPGESREKYNARGNGPIINRYSQIELFRARRIGYERCMAICLVLFVCWYVKRFYI